MILLLDRNGELDHDESFADGTFASAKKGVKRLGRQNEVREPRSWFLPKDAVFPLASTPRVPALMK